MIKPTSSWLETLFADHGESLLRQYRPYFMALITLRSLLASGVPVRGQFVSYDDLGHLAHVLDPLQFDITVSPVSDGQTVSAMNVLNTVLRSSLSTKGAALRIEAETGPNGTLVGFLLSVDGVALNAATEKRFLEYVASYALSFQEGESVGWCTPDFHGAECTKIRMLLGRLRAQPPVTLFED